MSARTHLAPLLLLVPAALACGGSTGATGVVVTGTATPAGAEALTVGDAVEGDTTNRADTSSPTCGEPDGAGDQVWAFTPEADGWFSFRATAGYDVVLSVRDDTGGELSCNDDGESKRDAEVAVQLVAGRTYAVVVDGFRDSEGTYRLEVEATEAALPQGRRGRIQLDQAVSDVTTDGTDAVTPTCGASVGSRDHAWHFVAPTAGNYRFLIEAEYDSVLSLVDQAGAELDCNDDFQSDTRRSQLMRTLEAGASIGVVVDGYSGAEGGYRLTVTSLGGGAPTSQGGTVVVGTPVNGSTDGGQDHYTPSCGAAAGSPDNVWQLTPAQSGTFRIHVDSQYDAVVSLWDESGAEVACNDDLNSTSESEVVVGLQAGRTYNVVVDGYNGGTGAYALRVTPEVGGGTPTPTPTPTPATGPFTPAGTVRLARAISDSTAGGTDMVQVGCNSSAGTPDDIWELTVPRRGNYQVHVAAQFDSVVALLDAQHTELVCNDDHRTTRESLVRSRLTPGQTYYVVVSGYQAEVGSYVLTVRREPKPGRRP